MMRKFFVAAFFTALAFFATHSNASFEVMIGASDPYYLGIGAGEPNGSISSPGGFADATGRVFVAKSSLVGSTVLIITTWQSNIESANSGSFSTVNATTLNFNLYDRGLYKCANPVLGAAQNNIGLGSNSANCQIPDALVTAGTYANAIVAPNAIGGTLCSDWAPGGQLNQRIVSFMNGLKSAGLTANTGFTGDTFLFLHGGETDNVSGTPRPTLATCIRNWVQAYVDNGLTNFRTFVASQSMVNNAVNASVTGAQADAVASGCSSCRAGFNSDSLTGGTYRQADGTHGTAAYAAAIAAGDVAKVQACVGLTC